MDTNVIRAAMYPTYIPSISRNGVIHISPKTNTTTGGGRLPTMIDRQCHGFIPSIAESMPNLMMGEASLRMEQGRTLIRKGHAMKSTQAQTNNLNPPINETEHQSAIPNPSPLTTSPSTTPPPPSVHCCGGGGSLSENPSRLIRAPLNGGRGVDGCAYVLEQILFSAE